MLFSFGVTSSTTLGITPAAAYINCSRFIDVDAFDRLSWILVNPKCARHIVNSTNWDKAKGRFESPLSNAINSFVNSTITTHAKYCIEPAFASIFSKTCCIAFSGGEFDLNRFE